MPLLISVLRTVDAILKVGVTVRNQAIQNGRCHICFSLYLDKVETGYNLLMEYNALAKCLIVHTHTGLLAVSFYLLVGAALSLIFQEFNIFVIKFYGNLVDQPGSALE